MKVQEYSQKQMGTRMICCSLSWVKQLCGTEGGPKSEQEGEEVNTVFLSPHYLFSKDSLFPENNQQVGHWIALLYEGTL